MDVSVCRRKGKLTLEKVLHVHANTMINAIETNAYMRRYSFTGLGRLGIQNIDDTRVANLTE